MVNFKSKKTEEYYRYRQLAGGVSVLKELFERFLSLAF